MPFVGTRPKDPDNFDVLISNAIHLGGAPEVRPCDLITACHSMRAPGQPDHPT